MVSRRSGTTVNTIESIQLQFKIKDKHKLAEYHTGCVQGHNNRPYGFTKEEVSRADIGPYMPY